MTETLAKLSGGAHTNTSTTHANLYKSQSRNVDHTIIERRQSLLVAQRQQRQTAIDDLRGLHTFVESLRKPPKSQQRNRHHNHNTKSRPSYRNQLQLSEWLRCRPTDFTTNWYMVPCPRGTRCIVVATDGCTDVYSKHGVFQRKFQSALPGGGGGGGATRHNLTVLDCVHVTGCDEFWILDVLAYGNQSVVNCEASFRFFWIANKVRDDSLAIVEPDRNECSFRMVPFVECSDEPAMAECLQRWPMWPENRPELDGLLFYHKESSYVAGVTPLVGWLYPFMLTEILGLSVQEQYTAATPSGYVGAQEFIDQFEANLRAKRNRSRRNRRGGGADRMDEEPTIETEDEHSLEQLMDAERALEMDGQCLDDENDVYQ